MLQAQEIKIKLQIEDLRREKEVFEDAFRRMSRDTERLQHVTENLQNQLSEAERHSSSARRAGKSCQKNTCNNRRKFKIKSDVSIKKSTTKDERRNAT